MNTLKTERRDLAIKARKLRREGFIVGSLFGKELEEMIPLKIEKKALDQVLKQSGKGSQITVDVEGKKYKALIKTIDYDSMKGIINEIGFQALVSNEAVKNVAEVVIENADKVKSGILQIELKEVSYSALPEDMVDKIIIDASTLSVGDSVKVKDLDIASNKKIHLHTDVEAVVVAIIEAKTKTVDVEESEEAEETAEA